MSLGSNHHLIPQFCQVPLTVNQTTARSTSNESWMTLLCIPYTAAEGICGCCVAKPRSAVQIQRQNKRNTVHFEIGNPTCRKVSYSRPHFVSELPQSLPHYLIVERVCAFFWLQKGQRLVSNRRQGGKTPRTNTGAQTESVLVGLRCQWSESVPQTYSRGTLDLGIAYATIGRPPPTFERQRVLLPHPANFLHSVDREQSQPKHNQYLYNCTYMIESANGANHRHVGHTCRRG